MEADAPGDVANEGPSGYLRTILTYNVPSEAEVDKAFLESHGIAACLLNANTSRNELGAPFYVRLQVSDGDVERACGLIREVNPQRFGSSARVAEIDRQIKRSLARFLLISLPIGLAAAYAAYVLTSELPESNPIAIRRYWVTPNFRIDLAIGVGLLASVLATAWNGRRRK
jgi:hypothetical protein